MYGMFKPRIAQLLPRGSLSLRAVSCARKPILRTFHTSNLAYKLSDPYKTLGVDKSASGSQIKKAYYKLAKQYHPDVNKEEGADTKFHDIQGAYDILSNTEKKAQFDQYGSAAFDQSGNFNPGANNPYGGAGGFSGFGGGGFSGGSGGGNPFGDINFEDLFGAAFGGRNQGGPGAGGRGSVAEYVGSNIELLQTISLKDAVFGKKTKVNYSALDTCNTCTGTGLKPGKEKSTCGVCHGTGQRVQYMQGGFQMAATCNNCGGSGVVISKDASCGTCHGEGVRQVSKSTEIDLPAGLSDGVRIKIHGEGDEPMITKSSNVKTYKGDLLLRIRVKPDPNFTVAGKDLIYKAKIPFTTAILGGIIQVPTIDGEKLRLKVPSGTNNDKVINMSDKGIPRSGNLKKRGDMLVQFEVKIPKPTDDTQVAILEALADSFSDTTATRTHPLNETTKPKDKPEDSGSQKTTESTFDKIKNFLKHKSP